MGEHRREADSLPLRALPSLSNLHHFLSCVTHTEQQPGYSELPPTCQRMLRELQFQQRPTVRDGRRRRMQGKARCPLFLGFRKNTDGLLLKNKFFSLWGPSASEGISETPVQMLRIESIFGRDKKKQLKKTEV